MEISFTEKQNSFDKIIKYYGSDQLNDLAERLTFDQLIEIVFYLDHLQKGFTYSKEINEWPNKN